MPGNAEAMLLQDVAKPYRKMPIISPGPLQLGFGWAYKPWGGGGGGRGRLIIYYC